MANEVEGLDLEKLKAEVAAMTPEQLKESLLKIRTREKLAVKKYYNSDNAKKYAAKQREKRNAMVALAKANPALWKEIEEKAAAQAEEALLEEATAPAEPEED